jgi:hypothetical protein
MAEVDSAVATEATEADSAMAEVDSAVATEVDSAMAEVDSAVATEVDSAMAEVVGVKARQTQKFPIPISRCSFCSVSSGADTRLFETTPKMLDQN